MGHINEQWPSYWAYLFDACGYAPFDMVRPAIWSEAEIPYWYQQNIILYIRREKAAQLGLYHTPTMLDLVHPNRWREELTIPLWRRMRQSVGATIRNMIN